jgi:type II secretory pathway pseudopilin PulG
MMIETNARRRMSGRAFTLVELLLTVALIFLLSGAVVFNFASLQRGARLDEGLTQIESIFRYARAEASNTGRRVEIVFGNGLTPDATNAPAFGTAGGAATNSRVQVLWEPDPVGAPGTFVALVAAAPLLERLDDLVQVREVRPGGSDDFQLPGETPGFDAFSAGAEETNAPAAGNGLAADFAPPVTCYPDGSSDSVEIILRSIDSDDTRRSLVTLSGETGALRHRTIALMPDGTRPPGAERTPGEPAMNEAPDQ